MQPDDPATNGLATFVVAFGLGALLLLVFMESPAPAIGSTTGLLVFIGLLLLVFVGVVVMNKRRELTDELPEDDVDT